MLNVGGGELIVIALVALIALGPEQLPVMMRKLGALSRQIRTLTSGLREEFLSGLEEITDVTDAPKPPTPPRTDGTFDPSRPYVPRGFAEEQAAREAEGAARRADEGHGGVPAPGSAAEDDSSTPGGGEDTES
jgi:sec-independent protein translocase protein TatB